MKKIALLIAVSAAFLSAIPSTQASPENTAAKKAHVATMCKDQEMRIMLLQELTSTKERRMEVVKMLKADSDFRSLYETMGVNPG